MLRWKKKLQKVWSNEPAEPNEFDLFMNPEEIETNASAGGGETELKEDIEEEETQEIESDETTESEEQDQTTDEMEESEEVVEKTPDESEISLLRKQNEELMGLVKNLTNKEPTKTEPEPEPEIDPFESDLFKQMTEAMNWDDDEAKTFKAFFKLYTDKVINSSVTKASELTPDLINQTMTKQQQMTQLRDNFYSDNPALANIKSYVSQVASQVANENKNLSLSEVLTEAAERAYKTLGIDKTKIPQANAVQAEKSKKPAFPKSKGARKGAPKTTALSEEFASMLALDE